MNKGRRKRTDRIKIPGKGKKRGTTITTTTSTTKKLRKT